MNRINQERNPEFGPVAPVPKIIEWVIIGIMPVQFGYSIFFNLIPKMIRLPVAGSVMLAYLIIGFVGLFYRSGNWRFPAVVAIIVPPVCWLFAISIDPTVFDLRDMLRESLPYIATLAVLSFPDVVPFRMLRIFAVGSLLIAAAMAFIGEPYIRGGIIRLHPFTGGAEGLHASTFFVFGNIIIVDQLRRYRMLAPAISWTAISVGLITIIMFQVRTTWLMLAVYYISSLYLHIRKGPAFKAIIYFMLFLGVIGIAGFLLLSDIDIGRLGSGRIAAYQLRFEIMMNRDIVTFLFGSGPGTDLFTSRLWMDKVRESHNDFIHTFIERGLIGFIGVLSYLLSVFIRLKGPARAMLYALIGGSLVSNGFLERPANIIYLLWAMSVPMYVYTLRMRRPDEWTQTSRDIL